MTGFEIPHEYKANRAPMDSDAQRCIDCGEPISHPYHAPLKAPSTTEWQGDNPFFLRYFTPEGDEVQIDLDQTGWIEEHKGLMRSAGTWLLTSKRNNRPLFCVLTFEGDQFYYAKRHVGVMGGAVGEVVAIGIGKKQADGTTVNLWLMPNGMIVGGSDVDTVGIRLVKGG